MTDDLTPDDVRDLTRRTFLTGAAAAVAALPVAAQSAAAGGAPLELAAGSGYWLGDRLWGNRLQDWISRAGRLECVARSDLRMGRTISLLTHDARFPPFDLKVRTGTLEAGSGFSGFVIGTGIPGEDWRRRVLVGAASGVGGGLLAVLEGNGQVGFREHTNELDQFAYAGIPSTDSGSPTPRTLGEDVTLTLAARAVSGDRASLTLTATRTQSGDFLSRAVLPDIATSRLRGGIGLMSSATGGSGARFWFTGLAANGAGMVIIPERALGPVVGAHYSVASSVLRMTVQLMPIDPRLIPSLSLEVRRGTGEWRRLGTSPIGPGYTALFRATGFDHSQAWGYRIVGWGRTLYGGTIAAEPRAGRLRVATLNCAKATHRPLDSTSPWDQRLPGSEPLDLYSVRNVYFPHEQIVASIAASNPDLVVAHGDQLYETSPTKVDGGPAPELDWLYKYLLWVWSFRPLTRRLPTIVLVDDHDVYQGNLWGNGGIAAPNFEAGGYTRGPDWVNLVQRIACWHNPDRYDATPVAQNISVYYSAFRYGGTSFAIIEDRKFKTGPDEVDGNGNPIPADELVLLGGRQEAFLAAWRAIDPGLPKVILTQTAWACVQTDVNGEPPRDKDSNGWPPGARLRAIRLAKAAGALIVSGDQHNGSLIRHGIDGLADGPLQFTPPAVSTSFQRWFQPNRTLPNAGATPHTGDWTDSFGNQFRVLAVANPRFTLRELWEYFPAPRQDYGYRGLKREGFGMLLFDHGQREVTLECRPWQPGLAQYAGWPVTVAYGAL